MIHYIIAAGIGAFLGSQSKKSKKSYAHGGEVQSSLKKYDDSRKKLGIDHPTTRYWGGYYDGIYALEDGNAMSKDVALKKYNSISEKLGSDHPTTNFWGGYYDAILDQNSYAKGGEVNGKYLDSISADKKSKILNNIAKHYGISSKEAEEEVVDLDAENLFEYIANDNSLRMQVYNDFKRKNYAEGGYLYQESDDRDAEFTFQDKKEANEFIKEHNRDFETNYKSIDDFNKGEEYRKITKSYAKGGKVEGRYSSIYDFIETNNLEQEANDLFGEGWEAEDDIEDIRALAGVNYDVGEIDYETERDERADDYIEVKRFAKGGKTNFEIPFSFNVSDVKTQLKKQGYSEAKINKAFQGVNVSMSKDFKENIVDAKGLLDNLPTQDYRELAMNVPATVLGMQKRNK